MTRPAETAAAPNAKNPRTENPRTENPPTENPSSESGDRPSVERENGSEDTGKSLSVLAALTPVICGLVGTGVFYGFIRVVQWAPLQRYFEGHPVAVAATTLFGVAVSILAFKSLETQRHKASMRLLRDSDLLPPTAADDDSGESPATRWRQQHDAGHVARSWRESLRDLPAATRRSDLVRRLDEVLTRQSHRSGTADLPEDLRELSIRDADAAHDSLGLIRIIVWAIPMLGFLGTVIGITQTLGGLDFTDGTAAVDRLKSGLYVAFDTTALGLVLSVVAIFLQFPVERGQQGLLADIDARVRGLVSIGLPADDPADGQTALITHLCSGIEVAVAESLATQARLWRETIEEAQTAWRTQHNEGTETFRQLLQATMQPALARHADRIESSVSRLDDAAASVGTALREQTAAWRESMRETAVEVQTHRRTLLTHTEAMTTLATRQIEADAANQERTGNSGATSGTTTADAATQPAIGEGVVAAMTTLARAVDVLSRRMPPASGSESIAPTTPNRRSLGRAA